MGKHKSTDYKLSAVKYYLNNDGQSLSKTCFANSNLNGNNIPVVFNCDARICGSFFVKPILYVSLYDSFDKQ